MNLPKRGLRILVSAVMALQLLAPIPGLAEVGTAEPAPVNLDLTSSERTISAGDHGVGSAAIDVGGVTRTVSPSDLLTPAELVAVQQVLATGQQSILLGALGNAVGGSFQLSPLLTDTISALVVPAGVTAVRDFGHGPDLTLTGNLINAGQLFAVSSSASVSTASITAAGILNQPGGLISSVLPPGGLAGLSSLLSQLNLNLTAVQDIVNAGTIASSGNLNLVAGGSVINALPAGVAAAAPVMTALGDVSVVAASLVNAGQLASQLGNINAATASLVNSGVIQAAAGSVAVQNLAGNTLAVENALGLLAARDRLLFSTLGTVGTDGGGVSKARLSVSGGTLSAADISFVSPDGVVDVVAQRLDGPVNVDGGVAYVGATEGDLRLAGMRLTGDPIYFAGGNLDISGLFSQSSTFVTNGGDFVALAGGDLIAPTAPANALIDASPLNESAEGNGKITLMAGVSFTPQQGQTSPISCTACSFSTGGASSLGGDIVLPTVSLKTNKVNGTITLQALAGSSSEGSIAIKNVDASGVGGTSAPGGNPNGTKGGSISISAASNVTTGYLRAYGGGGAGGVTSNSPDELNGGLGGNGGTVVINSTSGSVLVNGDINVSGGGGGGGAARLLDGAERYGAGGNGGAAGSITIGSTSSPIGADVTVNGPLLAAAGGGGGAGGYGGGGGGGGSYGGGGGGGAGDTGLAGGGGGGFYGGGSGGTVTLEEGTPVAGSGGGGGGSQGGGSGGTDGGVAGDFGKGAHGPTIASDWNAAGKGGEGGGRYAGQSGSSGAGGGNAGQAGGTGGASGGAAGNCSGCRINIISGGKIALTETIDTGLKENGQSLPALGTGTDAFVSDAAVLLVGAGNVTIANSRSTLFVRDANYADAIRIIPAVLNRTFVVGAGFDDNGSIGRIRVVSPFDLGKVYINSADFVGVDVSSGSFPSSNPTSVTIKENGTDKTIQDGELVTPAEWIAIVQKGVSGSGSQSIVLNASGNAAGGSIAYAPANLPAGGFTHLRLPANVTAAPNSSVPALWFQTAEVNGTIDSPVRFTLHTQNLVLNGSITSSTVNAAVFVRSSGSLTVSGVGRISGPVGNAEVSLIAGEGGELALNGWLNLDGNKVTLSAASSGGSIVIAPGVTFVVGGVLATSSVSILTPNLTFAGDDSKIAGPARSIEISPGTSAPLTITVPTTLTLEQDKKGGIQMDAGGTLTITGAEGQPVTFARAQGAGSAIFALRAGAATDLIVNVSNGSLSIQEGVKVNAAGTITLSVNNGVLSNHGVITSALSGSSGTPLTIQSTGSLSIAGPGAGAGEFNTSSGNIVAQAGGANTLSLSGALRFSPGVNQTVTFRSEESGGSVSFAAGASVTAVNNALLKIRTGSLSFGAGAALSTNNSTSSNAITVDSGSSGWPLAVTLPANGSATLSTFGGTILVSPGETQALSFLKASGAGQGILNLNGAPVMLTASGVTVAVGATVQSNRSITLSVANGGAVVNDGMLATSGQGETLRLLSRNGLSVGGNGNFSFTGGVFGSIVAEALAGELMFEASPTFNAGVAGLVSFTASGQGGSITIAPAAAVLVQGGAAGSVSFTASAQGGSVTLAPAAEVSVQGGATLTVVTPKIALGAGSSLNSSKSTTGTAAIVLRGVGTGHAFTLEGAADGSSTVATSGAGIEIGGGSTSTLSFVVPQGASGSTAAFNGGVVSVRGNGIDIGSGFNLTSNNTLLISGGTITSSGAINGAGVAVTATGNAALANVTAGGALSVIASGMLTTSGALTGGSVTLNAPIIANSGIISGSGPSGTVSISSPASASLTISGGGTIAGAGGITLTAAAEALTFTGNQALDGNAVLNAIGEEGRLSLDPGVTVTGTGNVTVNTCFVSRPSGLQVTGDLTMNLAAGPNCPDGGGTIVNPSGDVVLTGNLIVNTGGKDLAIIASGNITLSGKLNSINLSSKTGRGGTLTIIAGFDVSFEGVSTPSEMTVDSTNVISVTDASASGGAVTLPAVQVDTSSAAPGRNAGNVVIVAKDGAVNHGTILIGGIKAVSAGGKGGNITLIGESGVQVLGAIDARGAAKGGSVTISGSAPVLTDGALPVFNGIVGGPTRFEPSGPVSGVGAALLVNGGITTMSTGGEGGAVSLTSDSRLEIAGTITTSGLVRQAGPSASVLLTSLDSAVSVTGSIITSAFNIGSSLSADDAARAGSVTISAPSYVTIGGSILSRGGSTAGTGNGGAGGAIDIRTGNDNPRLFYTGFVEVKGSIDAAGGNGRMTQGGGGGGPGGSVFIRAGALRVLAASREGSIIVTWGKGGSFFGAPGQVDINTYAVQPFPIALTPTSTLLSEYALPGGLFTVGVKSPVNGTAGSIVNGSMTASLTNAGRLDQAQSFSDSGISIQVTGGAVQINRGGLVTISPDNGAGVRNKVTAGDALALFQVSRTGLAASQTIGLNALGQLTGANPQSPTQPSTMSVPAFELVAPFTSFRLETADGSQKIQLTVSGSRPALDLSLSRSTAIAGTLAFPDAGSTAFIELGRSSLLISPGGSITTGSTGKLLLSGTGSLWFNGGTISSAQLVLINFGGSLTFSNANGASIIAPAGSSDPRIVVPAGAAPSKALTIQNLGGEIILPVSVEAVQVPTLYKSAVRLLAGGAAPRPVTLQFSLVGSGAGAQEAMVRGDGSVGALTVRTLADKASGSAASIRILGQTDLSAVNLIQLLSAADVIVESGARLLGGTLTKVQATKVVTVSDGARIEAGALVAGAPAAGLLATTDIALRGSVQILSGGKSGGGGVSIGSNVDILAAGGDVSLVVTGGGVSIADTSRFQSNGGNVTVLASGPVTGGQGNVFVSRGAGGGKSITGGSVEIGSGVTKSMASSASKLPPGTVPSGSDLGVSVTINNIESGRGIVRVNTASGGSVDLTSSDSSNSTINLNRGYAVFDAIGSGASIQFNGVEITIDSYKPIAYRPAGAPTDLLAVDDEESSPAAQKGVSPLAYVLARGSRHARLITVRSNEKGRTEVGMSVPSVEVGPGHLFIHALRDMEVSAGPGRIAIKRGAMVAIESGRRHVRVASLSGKGCVSVVVVKDRIVLAAGQEVLVTEDMPSADLREPADGVGRRRASVHTLGCGMSATMSDISIVSMLRNAQHLGVLRQPQSSPERSMGSALLKTAAAVEIVTRGKGRYTARSKESSEDPIWTMTRSLPARSPTPAIKAAL